MFEYEKVEVRDLLFDTVDSELEAQLELVCTRSRAYGELDGAGEAAFRADFARLRSEAMADVQATLSSALQALREAECVKKLREALEGLDVRERFNVNNAPVDLPTTPNGVWALFDVPMSDRTPALYVLLQGQWKAHVAAWLAPAAGTVLSNRHVFGYWDSLRAVSPQLSAIATLHWLRPINSASCERVYSILTQIDTPTRRSMGRKMLYNLLFLAGNAHLVGALLRAFAESVRIPQEMAVAERLKRRSALSAEQLKARTATVMKKMHRAAAAEGVGAALPFQQFSHPIAGAGVPRGTRAPRILAWNPRTRVRRS